MQYEILYLSASGLEMPQCYAAGRNEAEFVAIELAEAYADGGYTGRAVVRNAHDEAMIYVTVRGPLMLVHNEYFGDIPRAFWSGDKFDYYKASRRYQDAPDRAFLAAR